MESFTGYLQKKIMIFIPYYTGTHVCFYFSHHCANCYILSMTMSSGSSFFFSSPCEVLSAPHNIYYTGYMPYHQRDWEFSSCTAHCCCYFPLIWFVIINCSFHCSLKLLYDSLFSFSKMSLK